MNTFDNTQAAAEDSRPGVAIALDSLTEELKTLDALLATLTHKAGPVLLDRKDVDPSPTRPAAGGSEIQRAIWERTFMVSDLNDHVRALIPCFDI